MFYLLTHFECDSHTVHMLAQQCLPPPLTSAVKLSLFTHVHSHPLSLAARLHRCHANHSHYINNGRIFSGKTSYFSPSLPTIYLDTSGSLASELDSLTVPYPPLQHPSPLGGVDQVPSLPCPHHPRDTAPTLLLHLSGPDLVLSRPL